MNADKAVNTCYMLLTSADPTCPFNGALFCFFFSFGAQWSNGSRYTVALFGIFCPMMDGKRRQNLVKDDLEGIWTHALRKRALMEKAKLDIINTVSQYATY